MALADLATLAVMLVIVTIVIAMGALINDEVLEQTCDNWNSSASSCHAENRSVAVNATIQGQEGLTTAAGFIPVVAIVVVAAVIIGIVATSFGRSGGM